MSVWIWSVIVPEGLTLKEIKQASLPNIDKSVLVEVKLPLRHHIHVILGGSTKLKSIGYILISFFVCLIITQGYSPIDF